VRGRESFDDEPEGGICGADCCSRFADRHESPACGTREDAVSRRCAQRYRVERPPACARCLYAPRPDGEAVLALSSNVSASGQQSSWLTWIVTSSSLRHQSIGTMELQRRTARRLGDAPCARVAEALRALRFRAHRDRDEMHRPRGNASDNGMHRCSRTNLPSMRSDCRIASTSPPASRMNAQSSAARPTA
jgi:hypothetical protein